MLTFVGASSDEKPGEVANGPGGARPGRSASDAAPGAALAEGGRGFEILTDLLRAPQPRPHPSLVATG